MTNPVRTTARTRTRTRVAAGLTGLALAIGLVPVMAPAASAAVLVDGDGKSHVRTPTPWASNRGTVATTLGTSIAGLAARLAATTGTSVVADIPKVTGNDGEKFRGAYAWVACPFDTATKAIDNFCTTLQGKPDAGTKIESGRVVPTGADWVAANAQGALFGVTNTLNVPYEMAGTWLTLAWTVQMLDQNGRPTGTYYNGQSPESILVLPDNPGTISRPLVTSAAVAGQAFTGDGARYLIIPNALRVDGHVTQAWLCANAAAATDPSLTWDVTNGCTRAGAEVAGASNTVTGTLPANSAGKFLVVNTRLTARPTIVTAMNGGYSWVSRSAAVPVTAPGETPSPAATTSADAATGDAGAAGAAASGSGASGTAGAGAAGGAGAVGAAGAAGAVGNEKLAAAAGVNLATAPLVGADGRGTGASAKLKMGLAASQKVNRGRYITVKAAIAPKSSAGKVRLVLVRTNAKGKVIASKPLFATVVKGSAGKRWQIPRSYTPGAYSLIATYQPAKKGAPGVTAVAPVTIG